jgi:L-asparaginase
LTILVVATGGTIASLPDPETGAVRPAVGAEELVAGVPELAEIDELEVVELDRVNGWNVTPAKMLEVARCLNERLAASEVRGAVVTHGTDTVEETTFVCDLLVEGDKPVAFAAAMRSGAEPAADGPRNLICAARVAAADDAAGLGAVLVMNDEVHAARWAVKTDSYRVSAFSSPGHGPLGHATPERLAIRSRPERFTIAPPGRLGREVAVVKTYTGMGEGLIDAVLADTGAAGLVLEGTGAGNVPGAALPGIARAAERGLPVVVATRTATGGTIPIYGGPGGGVTLRELGVAGAGGLTAAKARLLLMIALEHVGGRSGALPLFRQAAEALAPGAFGPD